MKQKNYRTNHPEWTPYNLKVPLKRGGGGGGVVCDDQFRYSIRFKTWEIRYWKLLFYKAVACV